LGGLIRLHGHGFHRMRASRAKLIESEADCYPQLAPWGQAPHDCPAEADGLLWRSRHYDDAYACLLFGDGSDAGIWWWSNRRSRSRSGGAESWWTRAPRSPGSP
jgi:hypothetical protein